MAEAYFQANMWTWWAVNSTLDHALDQLYRALTHQQAAEVLAREKHKSRSGNQSLIYLIVFCQGNKSHKRLVVRNIVQYAAPQF